MRVFYTTCRSPKHSMAVFKNFKNQSQCFDYFQKFLNQSAFYNHIWYHASIQRNENTDIEEMTSNCTESTEDATKVIHKFEEIIKNKKSDIVWLAYHQDKILQKIRSKERSVNDIITKFKVSKLTIVFKIVLCRLIEEYRKTKNSLLSLH